ncbi:PH, RCC1 and FYVE domains-containing protein 1-like [Tripterygium wilfordii]|uniref:PH, RCC1 and FYVE domains-containing protein 1-like n=1 Tax=Tripterygium wilfordii TaxID=458696 RepID=UPI0018F7E565|nr:PH, RCC1 and FYVE domains-containing protein 1-like [Tripterygium wilfordii]
MADPVSYGHPERDIEQALVTLKKGTQLIKYSRKGKPKFRAFRVSPDETTLIWISHGDERNLRFSSVLRIIPGQRTAVFRRYLRPEKDYLSFSLIYNNGERSLDLICKDKVEAEVWFGGLKTLIGKNRNRRANSDITDVHGGDFVQNGRPFGTSLDYSSSITRGRVSLDLGTRDSPLTSTSSDARSDNANMQLRTSTGDGFRISVSSSPSCSSGGSGPDDIESLGDVYVWGEVWGDAISDGSVSSIPTKVDFLTPKPLESNVVLDVHQIACGVRHVALVTRQGEVFSWGEESGGRLGHGIEKDFSHPRLVEFLAVTNVDFVACGEYHTCAVSTSGDLFTWGDGTHNAGLLGHGTDVSHWIPKRVSGPLEGLQVLSIACGSWHSALATSNGKLFTFGDGAFGVLGHGDRESVSCPKEVQLLSGLKTIKVACGVWHTAAIVEVMGQSGANISSRKLFTWGDGDKYRLGHGNKNTYLLPTCVSSLIDYNFHQLACGHTMTVALTTSGHVFTMGSPENGQLGNPISDGKIPCLVQDKLVGEFVEEIACGAYHVAVLTSRSEVLTWGRGANGRLGHGDTEDRKCPTVVETLKDRHVKNIACGSNFTSSICIHKWVSGADQSVCSGCRQAFGFTRKRHNCYNCGLVHCHACSSKKALKAALAPTPGKPHRVCDACYAKLKAAEAGNASNINRKVTVPRRSIDSRERIDRGEVRSSRILLSPTTEPIKYLEVKSGKQGAQSDSPSIIRASQVPSLLQLKDIAFPSSLSALQNAWKPAMNPAPQLAMNSAPQTVLLPIPQPTSNSRPSSPYSRRPSPPRSATPGFSRGVIDTLKKSNDVLHQEVAKLHNQIRNLKQKGDVQDMEIQKLQKNAQGAASLAEAESSRCRAAKDIVKSIAEQLKEMTEKLPSEFQESETFRTMSAQAEAFLDTYETSEDLSSLQAGSKPDQQNAIDENPIVHESSNKMEDHVDSTGATDMSYSGGNVPTDSIPSVSTTNGAASHQSSEEDSKSTDTSTRRSEGEKEIIEQFEPGVYVTFVQRRNGGRSFKRVRFSKRRFAEQQAEAWWNRNKERVLKRYNTQIPNNDPIRSSSIPATSEEHEEGHPSQEIQSSKEESSSEA